MKPVRMLLAATLLFAGKALAHGGLADLSVNEYVITGQIADPQQSGYVLSPRGRVDIQGWRHSLSQTAAFYFTLRFERATSAPAQTIAIDYDTRANLVARGVIRDAMPVAPHPRPFPARPFPAFVPDPPGRAAG
jgi:hypothetical protein